MSKPDAPLPEIDAVAVAKAAGLEKALALFPRDVADAAQAAARARNSCPAISDATAEPWPPMALRRGA